MKTLLKLICWSGLAASFYYLGFSWWIVPILCSCLILVELLFGISENAKEDITRGSYIVFGIYFAVVALYVFFGDDYLGRAIACFYFAKYILNLIMPFMLVLVWAAVSDKSYRSVSRRDSTDYNDDASIYYDNAYGQKRDIIDQLRVENLGDVASGAKNPDDPW